MTDRSLQFTLRQWWQFVSAPKTVIVVAAVGLVLGLSGPFGSYEQMHPLARLVYWELVAFFTFGIGWLNARLIGEHTPARRLGVLPAYAVAGLVGGIPIYAVVALINVIGNIHATDDWQGGAVLFAYCTAVNFCVCMLVAWLYSSADRAEPEAANAAPRLLRRLPIELRGPLSHLSMQDHYVEVVTDRGSQLVLMRLADAIGETEPVSGLQVHRSHWIALDAVARTRREKDRYVVEMKGGAVLPISRSSLPAARRAGLIPAG